MAREVFRNSWASRQYRVTLTNIVFSPRHLNSMSTDPASADPDILHWVQQRNDSQCKNATKQINTSICKIPHILRLPLGRTKQKNCLDQTQTSTSPTHNAQVIHLSFYSYMHQCINHTPSHHYSFTYVKIFSLATLTWPPLRPDLTYSETWLPSRPDLDSIKTWLGLH